MAKKPHNEDDLRDNILRLYAEDNTEALLQLYHQTGQKEAQLMQARYDNLKSDFATGKASPEDWKVIKNRINFGLLELLMEYYESKEDRVD